MPIYAECGGMMYLTRALEDDERQKLDMVGVMDARSSMKQHVRTIGYVIGKFERDTPIGLKGTFFKGHEFHYSVMTDIVA